MKTLEDLNSTKPFADWVLDENFFRYVMSHREDGRIVAASPSKEKLLNGFDPRCFEDYEILTKLQYKKKWKRQ